jgi:hypothetical protein
MLNTRANKFKVTHQKQWIKKDTPTPECRWHHNNLPLLKKHILYISELIHTQHICKIWLSSFATHISFPNPPSIWENNCRTIYLNEHYIFYSTFLQRLTNKWFPWTACFFIQPIIININTDSCVMLYCPHLSVNTFCQNYKSFLCQKHIHHRENTTQEQWLPCKLGLTHSITHARVLYKVHYCYFEEFVI